LTGAARRPAAELILCSCNTVFESEVVACARRGAKTLEAIGDACEAGTSCGSCRGAITTILEEEEARRRRGEGIPEALLQLPLFQLGGGKDKG
jgi:NAD(P)H-nitrite reductase large subunit